MLTFRPVFPKATTGMSPALTFCGAANVWLIDNPANAPPTNNLLFILNLLPSDHLHGSGIEPRPLYGYLGSCLIELSQFAGRELDGDRSGILFKMPSLVVPGIGTIQGF